MFQAKGPDWEGIAKNRMAPPGKPLLQQTWHDLIFLHARVPVEVLQSLVPDELIVEEFDHSAWLGFVPFRMSKITKPGFPVLPWLGSFHETNVRTYVSHPKFGPGVWFFSLDAARFLACWYARQFFKLPYFHADLKSQIEEETWHYAGRRNSALFLPKVECKSAELTDYLVTVQRNGEWHAAEPGTFEFWLVERYRLYSKSSDNRLLTARVFHPPYEIACAKVSQLQISGLEEQFGTLEFSEVLMAKTLNVQCFLPEQVS
jgi:uncharacterized protein YqjF (DUF2071 family)